MRQKAKRSARRAWSTWSWKQQQREAGEALKSQDQQIAEAGATLQEHGITAEETTLGEFHQHVEDHGSPEAPEPVAEPEAYEPTEADYQEMSDHYEPTGGRAHAGGSHAGRGRPRRMGRRRRKAGELEGEQAPDVTEPEADAPEVSEPGSPESGRFRGVGRQQERPGAGNVRT